MAEALWTSPNIQVLRVGGLEERVALYADDMLLFLRDAGPSLEGALELLDIFSPFTGLKVNWGKSILFPIDQGAQDTTAPNSPLKWVMEFTYLGIIISRQAEDFQMLKLDPVIQEFRKKLKVWEVLPLSLLGRINLIKMKILPKFLYLFRNSPQWLPKSFFFFTGLHGMFSTFTWANKPARIKLSTLMQPVAQGGLAFPDLYKYYLATQLVTVERWLNPDGFDSATMLEAAVVKSVETL